MLDRLQRVALSSVLVALAVGACGSGGSTPAAAPSASPASTSGASPSASVPVLSPGSSVAVSPSAVPSGSASGAVSRPSGTPCEWLDKATIDAALGLSVGPAIPNTGDKKGELCTWLSKTPQGGITLAIVSVKEFGGFLASYQKLPGGQLVPGLGVHAVALFLSGQKAPLPASHANLFVDYGDWVLSVDVSGPAVTVGEAAALAAAAAIP